MAGICAAGMARIARMTRMARMARSTSLSFLRNFWTRLVTSRATPSSIISYRVGAGVTRRGVGRNGRGWLEYLGEGGGGKVTGRGIRGNGRGWLEYLGEGGGGTVTGRGIRVLCS